MKKLLTFLISILCFTSFSQEKSAYKIFDKEGKEVDYSKLLKIAEKSDLVLFGEFHNNPIIHWLQLELTKDLYGKHKENLALAAEMFEADNQLIIDEYLSGKVSEKSFEAEARLWPNYETDYKPLMLFAKENKLPFVAANVPRRYANMVYSKGLESLDGLTSEAKSFIAPLPIPYDSTLKGYVEMVAMSGGHGGQNLPRAQAIKDATMAHFVGIKLSAGKKVIHYNGAYHSDNYEGIAWYLRQNKSFKKTEVLTISCAEQTDISNLEEENKAKADFIICVPESMTKTH